MLFDTHAHLNFEAFQNDWQSVLADCKENDIWVTNIGSQYLTSKRAVEIAEQYNQGVYASVGVHPIHAHELENIFDYKKFKELIISSLRGVPMDIGTTKQSKNYKNRLLRSARNDSGKVVAIGETGLDFFHSAEYFDIQKKTFINQINLAKEFDLPLIIHSRNSKGGKNSSYQEILKIVKREKVKNAVVHCYGGTAEEAKKFLDLGFYIGITGIVTFKNARELQEIVRDVIPLEKILIETDSPWLAPQPHRGEQNKPPYVEFVARKIAELKIVGYYEISKILSINAKKFFKLD